MIFFILIGTDSTSLFLLFSFSFPSTLFNMSFSPSECVDWTNANLQDIQDAGGLECVIVTEQETSLRILKALVGKRTQFLRIDFITAKMLNVLPSLNASSLKHIELQYCYNVKTFEALRDLEFSELTLYGFEGSSLQSLENLTQLKKLSLKKFQNIRSLDFLKNMTGLTELTLIDFPRVSSLEPIGKLRLHSLTLEEFPCVLTLNPLQDLRPTSLTLVKFPEVSSLQPLSEMRPETLVLKNITEVSSLQPLSEMRPETLVIEYLSEVKSFDPLRDMRPTNLTLHFFSEIDSLDALRDMRPDTLNISSFPDVESLEPLSGMRPTNVSIKTMPKLNLTSLFQTFVSRG